MLFSMDKELSATKCYLDTNFDKTILILWLFFLSNGIWKLKKYNSGYKKQANNFHQLLKYSIFTRRSTVSIINIDYIITNISLYLLMYS